MKIEDLKKVTEKISEQKKIIEEARTVLEHIFMDLDEFLECFERGDDALEDALENFEAAIETLSKKA